MGNKRQDFNELYAEQDLQVQAGIRELIDTRSAAHETTREQAEE